MSIEHARKFIEKLKAEPDLYKKAASFETKEERRQWAKTLGYDFTAEEVRQAAGELSDEDLERVAGGHCCGSSCEQDCARDCGKKDRRYDF